MDFDFVTACVGPGPVLGWTSLCIKMGCVRGLEPSIPRRVAQQLVLSPGIEEFPFRRWRFQLNDFPTSIEHQSISKTSSRAATNHIGGVLSTLY